MYQDTAELWREELDHTRQVLSPTPADQEDQRFEFITPLLNRINELDAVAARGGPLQPMSGGVFRINPQMLSDYRTNRFSAHASNLGALLAHRVALDYQVPAYIVDPVTTDEFWPEARLSGVPGIERKCRSHALNIHYCARLAAEEKEIPLSDSAFVVAHLGSGISIAAVAGGRIVDVNDGLLGMGPFSVERAGSLPLAGLIELCFTEPYNRDRIENLLTHESGFQGYLGTKDFREIIAMVDTDERTKLVYSAFCHQLIKEIGGMNALLGGKPDGLLLTGGLTRSDRLVNDLSHALAFMDSIVIYPGAFESQALAKGVLRVLTGRELAQEYSAI